PLTRRFAPPSPASGGGHTRPWIAAILLLSAVGMFAQRPADPDLERIRGDIARLKQRLADVRNQARTVELEVEAADLELGIRTRELEMTLETHARLERERIAISGQIAALVERIARQKESLGKRLVALYRLGGLSYVRLFLSLGEQQDPSAAVSMLSYLVTNDARMISRFRATQDQLALRNEQLAERQRQLAATAKLIEQQRQSVAAAHAEKERLLARLRREASGSELQIAELEEKARRLERLVALLADQHGEAIAALDVRSFRGALAWPVEGRVIETFGRQRNPKFATYTVSNGLKIAAAPRAPVRAVFQGTVLFSQWFKGYGNLIILDHGNRVFSLYGNLNGPTVTAGDRISTGAAIAGVGEAEDAESGYLYFEIRQDNRPEDPKEWLR
ncbi:MAG TPA: peptidoglycan DD-metalloendopeptidase family protein, partial [Thermoanaerobaculia bacterium]|nr:peptidoglycan DD-metalloendopeptidase family protein [Thermoanaerobaculia bacterium]